MITLTDVAVPLDALLPGNEALLKEAAAQCLNTAPDDIMAVTITHKSVDARKKSDVHFVLSLDVAFESDSKERSVRSLVEEFTPKVAPWDNTAATAGNIAAARAAADAQRSRVKIPGVDKKRTIVVPVVPRALRAENALRPVVVGTGPAGLFAALYLARAGMRPLVVERGASLDERVAAVEAFDAGGAFDPLTNIQFGEGGAGTFSDGKLTTNVKKELNRTVLEWFVEAGAPAEILVDAKPHIGTDKLREVVRTLRATIEREGGEVRFFTQLVDVHLNEGALTAVVLEDVRTGAQETVPATQVILATGHSARDTFALLHKRGLLMERKPFSVGVRVEHPQAFIDAAQYGESAGHPALGAADYKLSAHLPNGRGVYTFCMCPGGQVVSAASEEGGVVVNGMSVHARDGENANSAVLVSVEPDDFPGTDVMAGVAFQRELEQRAYRVALEASGVAYAAPAQRMGDFLGERATERLGALPECEQVRPSYARGVAWCDLHEVLPAFVSDSLEQAFPQFNRRLRGFAHPNAVLTGVETRSSSPVRVVRDKNTLQAVVAASADANLSGADAAECDSVQMTAETALPSGTVLPSGIFPCGEGAGYAGGIMSAAMDGIRAARACCNAQCPLDMYALVNGDTEERATALGKPVTVSRNAYHDHYLEAQTPEESAVLTYVSPDESRYEYRVVEDGSVRVEAAYPAGDTLVMPTRIEGAAVTALGQRALAAATDVRELVLPPFVTRLDSSLLRPLAKLERLTLPSMLVSFESSLLRPLKRLEYLRLPDVTTSLQSGFLGGITVGTLELGCNVSSIRDSLFAHAHVEHIAVDQDNRWFSTDGLALYSRDGATLIMLVSPVETYTATDACERVGRKAFADFAALTQVNLPKGVTTIESFAFFNAGLTSFTAPETLQVIEDKAFRSCTALRAVELNDGLRSLGAEAFADTALERLTLPATVDSLGQDFAGAPEMREGVFVPELRIGADNCTYTIDAHQGIYRRTSEGVLFSHFANNTATTYDIAPGTVGIEPFAFAGRGNLARVQLPACLERIGRSAFRGCARLESIEGSQSLRAIEEDAFVSTRIQHLYLPATFESLAPNALSTGAAQDCRTIVPIPHIDVDPACPVFYRTGDFLCQRKGAGKVELVVYSGDDWHVVVPDEVTEIGPNCMSGSPHAMTLEFSEKVELFGDCWFRSEAGVDHFILNCPTNPIEGHTRLDFYFAIDWRTEGLLSQVFYGGGLSVQKLFDSVDASIMWDASPYRYLRVVLGRLHDPLMLSEENRERFHALIKRRTMDCARFFALDDYREGFEQLVACGFLTKDNIVDIIDALEGSCSVETKAYLLELRRRVCPADIMAEYEL